MKLFEKYNKEKKFMRKRLVNMKFVTQEEEIKQQLDYYTNIKDRKPEIQSNINELTDNLTTVQDKSSGFKEYRKFFFETATVKNFLGIFKNKDDILKTLKSEISKKEDSKDQEPIKKELDFIKGTYDSIDTGINLVSIIKKELSFLRPNNLNPRRQKYNDYWNEEEYNQYQKVYNDFFEDLSLDTDIKDLLQAYIVSFVRFNFGIYFKDCKKEDNQVGNSTSRQIDDDYDFETNTSNLEDLAIYIHFLADIIGPSPLAKLYNLNNLQDDKTSQYANSFFGYSNSDITNLVNEFFGIMASDIINSSFQKVDCPKICKTCNMKTAEYLDDTSSELCTKCWKRSLIDGGNISNYYRINKSADADSLEYGFPETDMFSGINPESDMYVLFKETQFKKALEGFKTTTGNDSKMCDWWFYARENEAPSGQSKSCQKLMNDIWTKIRLQELF